MAKSNRKMKEEGLINVDVFIGGPPLLEIRLCEGLMEFGQTHPRWRFSLRGADFRYTAKWLREHRVDGVLALVDSKPVERPLNAAGIPWVHLLPPEPVAHSFVSVDDYVIGRSGAGFFLGKGFLRCFFCGVGTAWSEERARGFRERLAEADRECAFVDFPFEDDGGWGMAPIPERRLSRWVSGLNSGVAVMCAHDALANRLVDIALRHGLRVPRDIAVLGVGNHDMLCRLSPVPISSIDASVKEVAIRGAGMLESIIGGAERPSPIFVRPAPVVERRSTEILAYGDDLVVKVVAYIREHACERITAEHLLTVFPVSHRVLSRRFAKYVGHSPAEEIRKERLRNARRMLETTNMSLSEIAYACGYADLSHMYKVFREKLNTTPRSLRR